MSAAREKGDMGTVGYPAIFVTFYRGFVGAAREHGYALAVHGSLGRDLDLIAVPWSAACSTPAILAEAIRERVGGTIVNDPSASEYDFTRRNPQVKPWGRLAWSIQLGGGAYIDLSVMPPIALADEREACAKVCESRAATLQSATERNEAHKCAMAIRGRTAPCPGEYHQDINQPRDELDRLRCEMRAFAERCDASTKAGLLRAIDSIAAAAAAAVEGEESRP